MFSPEAEAKFFARVQIRPEDGGCWRWVGSALPSGYGMFRPAPGPRKHYAHRWACERWNGPIPDGHQVDHLCRRPWCVNPEHLEAVTAQENVVRSKGWSPVPGGYICGSGHSVPATGAALRCMECERATHREWRAERVAAGNPERSAPKSVEQKLRDEAARRARRLAKAKADRPDVPPGEFDRLGLQTVGQRLRWGWRVVDAHWVGSNGSIIGPIGGDPARDV